MDESEQPVIAVKKALLLPSPEEADTWFECHSFDHILAREPWRRGFGGGDPAAVFAAFAEAARPLLADSGDVVLLQSPPRLGERISRILSDASGGGAGSSGGAGNGALKKLAEAEEAFFAKETSPPPADTASEGAGRWTWDAETLERSFTAAGFNTTLTELEQSEERLLTEKDMALWFDPERSSWGKFIHKTLGANDFQALGDLLREKAKQGPILWKWRSVLLRGTVKD
jgi:putative ATPase